MQCTLICKIVIMKALGNYHVSQNDYNVNQPLLVQTGSGSVNSRGVQPRSGRLICQEFDLLVQLCQLCPSCLQAAVVWGSGPSPCQLHQQHLEQVTDHLRSPNKTQLQRLVPTPPRRSSSVFNLQFRRSDVMLADGMSAFRRQAVLGKPAFQERNHCQAAGLTHGLIKNPFLLLIHSDIRQKHAPLHLGVHVEGKKTIWRCQNREWTRTKPVSLPLCVSV